MFAVSTKLAPFAAAAQKTANTRPSLTPFRRFINCVAIGGTKGGFDSQDQTGLKPQSLGKFMSDKYAPSNPSPFCLSAPRSSPECKGRGPRVFLYGLQG